MPVFTRFRDDVLVLTVDGDFTPNELRRVARDAFHGDGTPMTMPVLLDMSGAAGLSIKSGEDLGAMGAAFGAYRDRISRLAVVAPAETHGLFAGDGDFGGEAGLPLCTCDAHAEARAWLAGDVG